MDKRKQTREDDLIGILENIQGGVILCNYSMTAKAAEVIYINRGWSNITGYTMEQLNEEKNGNPQALIFEEDKAAADLEYEQQMMAGSTYELLYRIRSRGGELRWVIDKGVIKVLPDGRMQNQSIVTEITAIKAREERMTLLAQTDQLTGLSNKATFTLLARTAISRRTDCKHALLMLDIDGFKGINDSYGHNFGDKVLTAIAEKLKETFHSNAIAGRVGGDEFMVLMTDVPNGEAVQRKTEKLCTSVRTIHMEEQEHSTITVSIGVSLFSGGKSYEAAFAEADGALYCAKGNGKDQYIFAQNSESHCCN